MKKQTTDWAAAAEEFVSAMEDEFLLAATVQNLRKLTKLRPEPPPAFQPA